MVKVIGDKKTKNAEASPLTMHGKSTRALYAARSSRRRHCVADGGDGCRQCTLTATCIRFCREWSSWALLCRWENQRMLS